MTQPFGKYLSPKKRRSLGVVSISSWRSSTVMYFQDDSLSSHINILSPATASASAICVNVSGSAKWAVPSTNAMPPDTPVTALQNVPLLE
jgi:hypothetical protein